MIDTLKKFNILLTSRQKKKLILLFIIMLVGATLEVCSVSMMLPLMTAFMNENVIETNTIVGNVCRILGIDNHVNFVMICIGTIIVIYIIKSVFLSAEAYAQARFITNNRFLTQRKLLNNFINRPYEFFLTANSGEIVRIIREDTGTTFQLLSTLLFFATESVVAIALIVAVFIIDPMITTFVALIMMFFVFIIVKVIRPVMIREGKSRQKHSALAYKWLLQSINGIKEIKVTRRERFFQDNYEKSSLQIAGAEQKNSIFINIPRIIIETVTVCSMLATVGIMVIYGRNVQSLIPTLGAFAMAAVKLLPSANRITNAFNAISFQKPALDKMIENIKVLDEDVKYYRDDITEVSTKSCVSDEKIFSLKSDIFLNNITYSYPGTEKKVLENARMIIPIGKSVGIVGASGSGKTTAIDIMLGLLTPQEGYILADGVDVMTNYIGWLSCMGYIPQSIFMLDDTIRANVAFGVNPKEIDDEQIWHALSEAHLDEFVRELPEGLDTSIGERGIRLSGGQRQRIGIARALYTDPEILVFDEATSSLDNETEAAIMESINSLHGKKTLVIIAHRLQTIEKCDIVYRVHDGKIERER